MDTRTRPDVDAEQMRGWRHAMHRHPELGFEEYETSELVRKLLVQWGYEVTTGIAGTGLVGVLKFNPGPARLGIRAEMDALPIQENTGLPWASQVPGKMHGCGHDGHTAMLLGAAEAFAKLRDSGVNWQGTLHLIFQPAEELGGGGGARKMIEEGLFTRFPCDVVFAMHNHPTGEAGRFYLREGAFMASSDKVKIRMRGKGGHGALPHLAADPVVAAANTIVALQSIVSRNVDPFEPAVVSVGQVHSGNMYNVIPGEAEFELSVRALHPAVRDVLERRIRDVAEGQAKSAGVACEIEYERGYPVLVNTPDETQVAIRAARKVAGQDRVDGDATPMCASEDFAFMLQERPGCYVMIGNGENGFAGGERIGHCSVHNPGFDFNDDNLAPGARFWVALAEEYLGASPTR
jgi:hippurate hydrolase